MTQPNQIQDVLRIEVRHANGAEIFDPNTLVMAVITDPKALMDLESSGAQSVISGDPALIYKTHEVEVALTAEEIQRLTMRSLSPVEFLVLREETGPFFEIHDDFYDERTGEALQPKR